MGTYCATVVTAVTAQNHLHVSQCDYVGDKMLMAQLNSTIEYLRPDAIKIGLIPCEEAAIVVRDFICREGFQNVVIDPVLKATAGDEQFSKDLSSASIAIAELLFPQALLITPNADELSYFAKYSGSKDAINNARYILEKYGARNLLIKGGHICSEKCIDSLISAQSEEIIQFESIRLDTPNDHGTGCTLSSAIASGVAKGLDLPQAITEAKDYLFNALKRGTKWDFSESPGPLCHIF